MIPTVGRIVHYHDGVPLAALITGVQERDAQHPHTGYPCGENCFVIDLAVFVRYDPWNKSPVHAELDVPFSETSALRHWSWPPKA